jgi:hypothetical protein
VGIGAYNQEKKLVSLGYLNGNGQYSFFNTWDEASGPAYLFDGTYTVCPVVECFGFDLPVWSAAQTVVADMPLTVAQHDGIGSSNTSFDTYQGTVKVCYVLNTDENVRIDCDDDDGDYRGGRSYNYKNYKSSYKEEIKEKKEKEKKERLEKLRKEKEKKEKEKEDEYNKFFSEIIGSKDKNKNLIDSKNEDLESDLFEEKEKNEEKITTENKIEEKETNEIEKGENGNDKENDYENYRKFLTIKDLIIWYSKHIYKYILFIYAIFLFKYGTIYPFMFFQKISPMWILYFEDISKKLNYYYILANILLFSPFSNESFYWLNPFVLVYNEITFFIIGSFLFYICYKYRIEMNIIIFISFFILLIAKIILGIFLFSRENFHYYPAMFFQYDNTYSAAKSYLSSNQFMKLHLFLLGMFFGNVYYCLTNKGISLKSKKYLELSVKFSKLKLFEFLSEGGRCSNILQYIFLIVFILIYIVLVNCYEMFISFYMKDKNNPEYYTFFSNKTFNIFALFDSDLGVIIFLLIILFLFFIRDNALSKFITHQFWRIIYKPYWSNLLLLHISTTFIFYYSENRIKFDFISIIFFAFQILILLTVLSCIFFVLIEMPLRNLNKIIIKKFQGEENEDNKEDDNDDNKENNDNDVDNDFN